MRAFKFLMSVALLVVVTGCSCRTKNIGDGANIGDGSAGGPLKDINYAFDSYVISPTAAGILKANADWLSANANAKAEIEGHCDERGTNEYNMVLGNNRARAAKDYLAKLGVNKDRMSTVSYGEEMPMDPRHNEEAWAKNRRAHFNVKQ